MGKPCGFMLVCVFMYSTCGLAFGSEVGNIHFGQLYVHPRIGVEATYDDNIFLLGERKIDDVLFTIRPGVGLDFTREGKSVRLNYLAEIGRYTDNCDYNFENHLVDAGVDLQFVSGWSFFVGDAFRRTTDRLTYEEEPLITRTQNTTDVKVGYGFTDRMSFQVHYDHMILDYENAIGPDGIERNYSAYDRDHDRITGTLFYRIFQRVSLLGQVQYEEINYNQENIRFDSDGVSGWVGITGRITPKMVALVKAGYQEKDYDNRDDWSGGVFSLDIVHRTTETMLVTIGASRKAVESTYSVNNYFTATEGRVGLEKEVGPKTTFFVSGFYANSDYPEATTSGGVTARRDDDIWGARVGVRYNIQPWLSTSVWYTHEERDSNQSTWDYEDNKVSLGVTAVF